MGDEKLSDDALRAFAGCLTAEIVRPISERTLSSIDALRAWYGDRPITAIARRLLELLPPAGDGELVTWEKLPAWGAEECVNPLWLRFTSPELVGLPCPHLRVCVALSRDLSRCSITDPDDDDTYAGSVHVPVPKTKGELRRLLAPFGLPLRG